MKSVLEIFLETTTLTPTWVKLLSCSQTAPPDHLHTVVRHYYRTQTSAPTVFLNKQMSKVVTGHIYIKNLSSHFSYLDQPSLSGPHSFHLKGKSYQRVSPSSLQKLKVLSASNTLLSVSLAFQNKPNHGLTLFGEDVDLPELFLPFFEAQ